MKRFPAQRTLLPKQGGGTEGVAAVQGYGVVENVQDPDHAGAPCSITLRRKASNIRRVQIEAL